VPIRKIVRKQSSASKNTASTEPADAVHDVLTTSFTRDDAAKLLNTRDDENRLRAELATIDRSAPLKSWSRTRLAAAIKKQCPMIARPPLTPQESEIRNRFISSRTGTMNTSATCGGGASSRPRGPSVQPSRRGAPGAIERGPGCERAPAPGAPRNGHNGAVLRVLLEALDEVIDAAVAASEAPARVRGAPHRL
jgi:hypothetical protein